MSSLDPRIGDIIAGKYRIERKLGGGGRGTVFAATHLMTGRRFALKWMNTRAGHDHAARERFIREFQAAGSIDHANVVAVLDAGSQDGSLYIVMEYLEGESLGRKISRGPMTPSECVPIVVEAMRGVAAAHRLDIVHRDLKPDNIFVCDGAERTGLSVKVLDFGVMKPMNARAEALPTITARGMAVGTPPYMAPEQVLALQSIDHRVDIYAFGVILYEALTGRLPFADATGLVLLERIVRGGAPALSQFVSGVPIGLEATIMRALSRDPRRRFQQLADFAACLRPWAAGAGEFGSMAPAPRRHPLGAVAEAPDGSFLALHPPANPPAHLTPPEERRVIEAVVLDSHATTPQPPAAEEPAPRELESENRFELPIEAALRRAIARESRLPQRHAWNAADADASADESSEDSADGASYDSDPGGAVDTRAADAAWEDAFTRGARGEHESVPAAPRPPQKDDPRRSRVPTLPLRLQDIEAMRAKFESERAARAGVGQRVEQEEEWTEETAITTELAAPRRSAISMYDLSPWPVEPTRDAWSAPTEMAVPAPRMPVVRNRTGWALVGLATVIVAGIAGLQWWDEEHVDEIEQSTSAASDIFANPDPAVALDDFDRTMAERRLKAAEQAANAVAPATALPPVIDAPASDAPQAPQRAPYEEAPVPTPAPGAESLSAQAPRVVESSEQAESAASEPAELASSSAASVEAARSAGAPTAPSADEVNAASVDPPSAAGEIPSAAAPAQPKTAPAAASATTSSSARTASASAATPTSASAATHATTSGGARGTTATLSTAPTGASTPAIASIEVVPASRPVAAHASAPVPQRDVVLLAASPAPETQASPVPPANSDAARADEPRGPTEYTFVGPAPLVAASPAQEPATNVAAADAPAAPAPEIADTPRGLALDAPAANSQSAASSPALPANSPRVASQPAAAASSPALAPTKIQPNHAAEASRSGGVPEQPASAARAASAPASTANAARAANAPAPAPTASVARAANAPAPAPTSSAAPAPTASVARAANAPAPAPTSSAARAASAPAPAPTSSAARAASAPAPAANASHAANAPQKPRDVAPAPAAKPRVPAPPADRPVATRAPEPARKATAPVAAAGAQKPSPAPAPRNPANTPANARAQNANTRPNATPESSKPIVLRAPGATVTVTELDVTPPPPPAPANAAPVDVPSAPAATSGNTKPAPVRAPRKTSGVSMTDF
jgi:serine/threonine-protein kinase